MYLANSAMLAIQSWKSHLLRSTHQDEAHLDIIDALGPEAVLIVNDWAIKFLPQWHRESQTGCVGGGGRTQVARIYQHNTVMQPRKFHSGSNHTLKSEHPEVNKTWGVTTRVLPLLSHNTGMSRNISQCWNTSVSR